MCVPTCACHDLHELRAGAEKPSKALRRMVDVKLLAKFGILRGNPCRTEIRIADSCADATDCLHGRVGDGDAVSAKCHCFDEVAMRAQATCDDQGNASTCTTRVQMMPSPCKRRNGRDRYMITEKQGGSACALVFCGNENAFPTCASGI